ncbi:hypothetical protein Dimus_014644 [Dionaea muscipula]
MGLHLALGLAQILNRLHRTSPKPNFLCKTCSLRTLSNSHSLVQNLNSIHNNTLLYQASSSGHSPQGFFIRTLVLGTANPLEGVIHSRSAKAPVFIEADEQIGDGDNPKLVADRAAEDAEKITKFLSNHPTSSGIEPILDNCGVEVSPVLVLEVLKRLSNAGVLALGFFRWAEKQKGFQHTTDCYNALIESLGKIKQFKMIDLLVSSMKSKRLLTKDTFMLVIRRYARARKVKEAVETFEKMEKFDLKPDSLDFNRFLNTLCKSRQVQHAQEMFDKMKKRRFDPDVKTYGILLEGWGQEQNLLKLNEVYQEMLAEGFDPDTVTYGIIIHAYCKVRKYDEAVEKFHEMLAKNCEPTPHIYCTLISGLGSEKRLDEALKFFKMSKASGFALEAPTYNAVVGSYCSSLRFGDAVRVIDEMRRGGVGPNARTYDIILHHLIKAQKNKEAYSVFQRMMSMELGGCEPEVGTYEIIVRMFCNEHRVDMAIKVWDQMKAKGILPGMHMFSALINSLCHENKLEDACKYFQEMLDMGIRPPGPMFSNLKEALLENGKKNIALSLAHKLDNMRKVPMVF